MANKSDKYSGTNKNSYANSAIFKAVIETSNASVWSVDQNYCLLFGNSKFLSDCKTGLGREMKEGETVLMDILSEKDKKEWKEYYDRALKGESFSLEYERKYSKVRRWNDYHFGPIQTKTGRCIGVSVVAHDVTEKKIAEQKLKESEELHRITLENINDPVFITKDDGTFTFICPNVDRNLGYTANEISKMGNISELLGENLFDLNELNSLKKIENIEHKLTDKKRKQHTFLISVKRVSIHGGTILYVCHDITERKRLQDELEQSKERFEELVKLLPEAVIEVDLNLNLTYLNQRTINLFGYSEKDIASRLNALEMLVPEEREKAKNKFAKRLKGKDPGTSEYKALKKDGSTFPILYHADTIVENGKIIGSRGVIVDITEQKKAERKLVNSEKRFKDLVKLLPEAVFEIDQNLNLTYVNQQAMDLFGYSKTDWDGGLKALEMIVPEEREKAKNNFAKRLKGEEPGTVEYMALKKDGSTFPILFHASSIIEDGKLLGARGVIVDISELKRAEQELVKSEEKFKNIFNNSVVGVSITNINGSLHVNKAFSHIVGYPEEELNKIKWQEFTHPEDIVKNQEIVDSILSGKIKTAQWEKRYIHKNGAIVWVDISTTLQKDEKDNPQFFITSIIDITERKKAEEEQKQMVMMLDVAPSSIMVHDFNGKFLYANQKTFDFHGYTRDEFMSLTLKQLDSPESAKHISKRMKILLEKGEAGFQVEHVKKDGTLLPLEVYTLVTKWNNKQAIISVGTDISERKRNEKALLQSYNLLNNLTSMVPGVVYQYRLYPDGHSAFPYASPGMYDIYEVMPEDVKEDASPVFTRIHPDDYDYIVETISESAKNQTLYHGEFRVILPKQGLRWRLCDAKPQLLEDGSTLWHGIISDITDRKNAEKEILKAKENAERNEREMNKAQKTAMVGSWTWHIRENRLWWSDEMYRIFDIDKETFTGELDKVITESIHPVDVEKVEQSNLSVINENRPIPLEYRILRKDGSVRYVFAIADEIVYDDNGKSKLLTGIVKDITDFKLIQIELLKAKEKAEESDRLKSAFLANMSHEIRTPMNGILGFAELLKEPQLSGEEQKMYIDIIEKSGTRMLNTINNIIDISKIEAGQMQISISEVRIREQVENILSFFKPEAEKKGVQVVVNDKLKDKDSVFYSDKEKIYAILTNLVKNALKYCTDGNIEIGMAKKENKYEFYVKDTGKGIPEDRQQAIFERFIQADIQDREALQGSGLGLAISKSYIEMLGGKIWLRSKEGQGSTFYFTIEEGKALKKSKENKDEPAADLKNQAKKLKILIAEDDQVSGMLVKYMLDKISSEIITTKTGTETVQKCRDNTDIDLVLMDIRMPHLDGYEATKKIREFNSEIIIIAQTAFALSGDREKAIKAGCNDYISKPISQTKLNELIKKYFP